MSFSHSLIDWYLLNKRDLPWRNTKDPYLIWVSEIILQQTRVEQGMPYYHRFVEAFPKVETLAKAPLDQVLKLWQGLGYYSRARNMHETAGLVYKKYKNKFPNKYEELIALKGIGPYTASAISSFSANEKQATVDGNVYRVLSRYFGMELPINKPKGAKEIKKIADELIPSDMPGTFNQALMDFGSMVCKPKQPNCETCPFRPGCYAFKKKKVDVLPIKDKAKARKQRFFYYFHFVANGKTLLQKREGNDIWKGLYEFPLLESETKLEHPFDEKAVKNWVKSKVRQQLSKEYKHQLSHREIFCYFIKVEASKLPLIENAFSLKESELPDFAVSRLMDKYLKDQD